MKKEEEEVQVGDQFGSRVVIQVGFYRPQKKRLPNKRILRMMCLHCGIKTVTHDRVPSSLCQLCYRNSLRANREKNRAHL